MATKNTGKKHKRTKNQKALNFLCIMMAFVVIFVAVVCISVGSLALIFILSLFISFPPNMISVYYNS